MMKRPIATAILAWLIMFSPARGAAQSLPLVKAPDLWVPLTARMLETESVLIRGPEPNAGHVEGIQVEGVYARNTSGTSYTHWTRPLSPAWSIPDVAVIIDRSSLLKWEIDYRLKNVRSSRLTLKGHPDRLPLPMTWKIFLKSHAQDASLGRKTISDIECVGYRIRTSDSDQKMYQAEVWFAPSLNFLALKYRDFYPSGRNVTVVFDDIKIGNPDPKLFLIPKDFSKVY